MSKSTRRPVDLWLVAACLLFSGAGSLVLEVVWSRLLKLVFGSTTLAIATILVAYMLGLGIGGLFGGRIARSSRSGVRTYGIFEMVIAVYALAVPHLLEVLPWVSEHVLASLSFWPAAFTRFVIVLALLFVPTLMMGATLPVLVAALARSHEDLSRRVGLLYGVNTLGAVLGVLSATFILFPALGVYRSNLVGAGLDFFVGALAAFVLAPRLAKRAATEVEPGRPVLVAETVAPAPQKRWSLPLLAYGLVGFTSLAYEVAWTRALAMITGASIYAFAVMLTAFLTGIALGSLIGRRYFDRLRAPQAAYAFGLALLGILAMFTMLSFSRLSDLFLVLIKAFGLEGSTVVLGAFVVSFLAMLAPTLVLGALFPLLTRVVIKPGMESSRVVADVYFVNTIGSATGAFAAGFLLIPGLGLQTTMAVLMATNFIAAVVVLMNQNEWKGRGRPVLATGLGLAAVLVVVFPPFWDAQTMTRGTYYTPDQQLTFGLPLEEYEGMPLEEILYYRDGLNTTVSIHRSPGGLNMRLGGKPDASLGDMSTQTLSGHIPLLFGPKAEKVLVIGYASGVTTGSAALYEPERVDVVELEPAVMEASRYFDEYNYRPQENPRVRVIVDDGRSYLQSTGETYDVIISEPSNPWISGASNLFTREYFQIARSRLAPDGRLLQWIQLYGMDGDALRSVWRAVRSEFRYVYGFLYDIQNVDFLMLASNEPLDVDDLPRWEDLSAEVQEDLRRVRVFSTADIWSLMQVTPEQIDELIGGEIGPINSDDSMFVELRAPWTLYNEAGTHLENLEKYDDGILGLLAPEEIASLEPRLLGELAWSQLVRRGNWRISRSVLDRAVSQRQTGAAGATVAESILRDEKMPHEERRSRALAVLDDAIGSDPLDPTSRALRARLRYQASEFLTALEDLNVALSVDPMDYSTQQLRVRVLANLDIRAAWQDVQGLLARNFGDIHPWLFADAAPAAAANGELTIAEEAMRRYLRIAPHSEREWRILAQIYRELNRSLEATAADANAERARRNVTIMMHRQALRTATFGSSKRAIDILERVVSRDPTNTRAREELAALKRGEKL